VGKSPCLGFGIGKRSPRFEDRGGVDEALAQVDLAGRLGLGKSFNAVTPVG